MLCKSQKLGESHLKQIDKLLDNDFSRKHLGESMFLSKFKEQNFNLQYLSLECFESMYQILDRALIYISKSQDRILYEQGRLFTKSAFHYYK